jgi:glutathione S-transferase
MLELYQYEPHWGLSNASPFCMKLQTYLQLAGIPYTTKTIHNPSRAPKGKLPFIKDGNKILADSSLIIAYLKKEYGDPLDHALTTEQKARALVMQRMLEEHYYWILVYMRWVEPTNWEKAKKEFFAEMPAPLRAILPSLIRRSIKKTLWQQGISRHSPEDIYAFGIQDLTALADLLTPNGFFLGDKPASIDAIIYAFIANTAYTPLTSPLKVFIEQRPEFAAYYNRMQNYLLSLN